MDAIHYYVLSRWRSLAGAEFCEIFFPGQPKNLTYWYRSFIIETQYSLLCLCKRGLHCPLQTSCCMHWFLARNTNPVFVSEVSCRFISCHTVQLFDMYFLDEKSLNQASCFMYHFVANTMITPVEILCTTLPHSPRTSYTNST